MENNESPNNELTKHILYSQPSIERLRIILMFFMCINLLGFPTDFGEYVQKVCGFVPPAFFIVSGFLVLREDKDRSNRILRAIKRCAIAFGILLIVYFAINFFYYKLQGFNIFSVFVSKRFWFNFVVLDMWQFDIGGTIWYVQALLYAYIIIYFLDKWKLLRFDWLIAAVLIIFTVITGELTGIIRWEILGYNYISGNFFTRALPYVMLGSFIQRKIDILATVCWLWYFVGAILGVALTIGEILLLDYFGVSGYYGHLIGMCVTAFSICMLAFQDNRPKPGFEAFLDMPRQFINCIYYFCHPVSVGIAMLLTILGEDFFTKSINIMSIITFIVCFFIAWLISRIFLLFLVIKEKRNE